VDDTVGVGRRKVLAVGTESQADHILPWFTSPFRQKDYTRNTSFPDNNRVRQSAVLSRMMRFI